MSVTARFRVILEYEDAYVQPLLESALRSQLPPDSYIRLNAEDLVEDNHSAQIPLLQIRAYEAIDFDRALADPKSLVNAYVIRKALIRKHFLSHTILSWTTKHPDSPIKRHFRQAEDFELDYAEFLDDALVEAFSLRASLVENDALLPQQRQWWILKPGMSDRGQGIRIFSTLNELQEIFEEWDESDSEDDQKSDESSTGPQNTVNTDGIMTSHLRHFIVQPYIHPPLLIDDLPFATRKFHIRTYVVAVGALRVFVWGRMLALFASTKYEAPWAEAGRESQDDLLRHFRNVHLTNTCVQEDVVDSLPFVFLLDRLPLALSVLAEIKAQINTAVSELFRAAIAQPTNFQVLPQAFEIFGVDFLVEDGRESDGLRIPTVQLLEVNAFPDFAQTGHELQELVIQGLFDAVFHSVVAKHFNITPKASMCSTENDKKLIEVLHHDLGRR